jgi:hypothetical protein
LTKQRVASVAEGAKSACFGAEIAPKAAFSIVWRARPSHFAKRKPLLC